MIAVCKIGETGKVFSVVLKSTNVAGTLVPHDLTGYTELKMQVEKPNGTVIMNQVECEADADQTTNTGLITCTTDITPDEHPNLIKGEFLLEFSGLNADGKKRYFPENAVHQRTYGKMVIQNALS